MGQGHVEAMLQAFAAIYRAEGRAVAKRTADVLLSTPAAPPFGPQPPAYCDSQIRRALAGSDQPAAAALLGALDHVPWGLNPVRDQMSAHTSSICVIAELMGPDAAIRVPDLRLGLLYLLPDTYYPLHNHLAAETYVMLAGEALWTAGADTWMRHAGDMIHHPSLMPHAFRAGPEGFVALYRRSGDIGPESYSFLDDPAFPGP